MPRGRPPGRKDSPGVVRQATRPTRKGNGSGLHGDRKGAGSGAPKNEPFAEGNPGCETGCRPTYKSLAKEARIDALKELQWTAAHEAESESVRHWAREALLDREEGKAIQRTQMSGPDGGPIMVVTGVPRAED